MGTQTKEGAVEAMRAKLVACMRSGKLMVINLDKTTPNWQDFDMGENDFPV